MLTVVQELYNELYNGQLDGSQAWLDSLIKDDERCLVEDCMLVSNISSSLNLQPAPVNSEHSYSMAADCSRLAPVVKTELDDCMYSWLKLVMHLYE